MDPSEYATSHVVATSKPRELGSVGPDAPSAANGIAGKLAAKAAQQAVETAPHSNGNGTVVH